MNDGVEYGKTFQLRLPIRIERVVRGPGVRELGIGTSGGHDTRRKHRVAATRVHE